MKALAVLFFGILILMLVSPSAFAASECKVKTNDIGTIVGKGRNPSAAFEDAATKCFDRFEQLAKMKNKGSKLDEDAGMVVIDVCANIKCS